MLPCVLFTLVEAIFRLLNRWSYLFPEFCRVVIKSFCTKVCFCCSFSNEVCFALGYLWRCLTWRRFYAHLDEILLSLSFVFYWPDVKASRSIGEEEIGRENGCKKKASSSLSQIVFKRTRVKINRLPDLLNGELSALDLKILAKSLHSNVQCTATWCTGWCF